MSEDFCSKHGKEFEAVCNQCDKDQKPMCAICLCEHIKEKHNTNATHLTVLIKESLGKLNGVDHNVGDHLKKILDYEAKAGEMLKVKDEIKNNLQEKLNKLKCFLSKQNERVMVRNSDILKGYEEVSMEIDKIEHNLRNKVSSPEANNENVDKMIKKNKYWKALQEVNKLLNQEINLDDRLIINKFEKLDKHVSEFKDQLNSLDEEVIDILGAKELRDKLEQNEQLMQRNEELIQQLKLQNTQIQGKKIF